MGQRFRRILTKAKGRRFRPAGMLSSHLGGRMTSHDQQEILTQEDRLTEATRAVDVNALDRIYANDLIFTGVTGVVCDKHAVMDEARRGAAARSAVKTPGTPSIVAYEKDD